MPAFSHPFAARLPFALVFAPALTLQVDLVGNIVAVITGFAGIGSIAVAIVGCLSRPLGPVLRIPSAAASVCLLFQGWISAALSIAVVFLDRRGAPQPEKV